MHGEFHRPRQLVVPKQLELILAWVGGKREDVFRRVVAGSVAPFDVREVALNQRPFCFLWQRVFDVVSRIVLDDGLATRMRRRSGCRSIRRARLAG